MIKPLEGFPFEQAELDFIQNNQNIVIPTELFLIFTRIFDNPKFITQFPVSKIWEIDAYITGLIPKISVPSPGSAPNQQDRESEQKN